MKIKVLKECGYEEALLGVGLSYSLSDKIEDWRELATRLEGVLVSLSDKDGGHNKFLESIVLWIDLTAPRYFHSEMDTYRIGVSKQSESTMHTIMKKPFTQDMFEDPIPEYVLNYLEAWRQEKKFSVVKNLLPEGFLQRRIICLNYKVLRNILSQRKNHKLPQWQEFCKVIYENVEHKEFLSDIMT